MEGSSASAEGVGRRESRFYLFLTAFFRCAAAQPHSQTENLAPHFYYKLANVGAQHAVLSRLQVYPVVLRGETSCSE